LIPFLAAGALFAEVYRTFPTISPKIYGLDLIGAAAGSYGVVIVLNNADGISTNFILSLTASLSAVLFSLEGQKKNGKELSISSAVLLISLVLVGGNLAGIFSLNMPIGANSSKEIHDALSSFGGKIIETKWSAFGRTDLVEFENYPDHMDIYIDGTAGSPMYRFDGNASNPGAPIQKLKSSFPGYFPLYHLRPNERDNALIIGPGGGRDILLALMGGVQKITAVEINKDLVEMVRRYAWFNGGIYTDLDNVEVVVEEGRNYLRRGKQKYDIIMLSLPVTNTSRSLEGYALTENFLFTLESIGDYLDHLTDEGRLVVVAHNDAEALRLLSLSLTALNEKGVGLKEAMRQIYIVGSDDYLVFVLKKAPFGPTEVFSMLRAMPQFELDPVLSYFPYIRHPGAVNPALLALASGTFALDDFVNIVKKRGYDISPVTDNSPFFYKLEVGIPRPISLVFWSSFTIFVLILWMPSLYWKNRILHEQNRPKRKARLCSPPFRPTVLFSMLGVGFMLIEISLIQRFVLFLGYPVLSLAVLLSSLLGGAGLGSLWSGRVAQDKVNRSIAMASLSVVVTVICYALAVPTAFKLLLGLALPLRLLASILMLIPLGFCLGIPFPLGIRWLKEKNQQHSIPWMWGINGVSSVIGSAMTVLVAISFGFTEALFVSAGCYLAIFLAFSRS